MKKNFSSRLPAGWRVLPFILSFLIMGLARGQTACCNGCDLGGEQVVNGNFSNPACGFGYTSVLANRCGLPMAASAYKDTTNVFTVNGQGVVVWDAAEHTGTPGSKALLVDGPTATGWQAVWQQNQQVSVTAGARYCFSAWVRNVCTVCGNPPSYRLQVTSGTTVTAVAAVNTVAYNAGWVQLCGTYTAASSGNITFSIGMLGIADIGGNDGMIDDISFRPILTPHAGFSWYKPVECGKPIKFYPYVNDGQTHGWKFTNNGATTSSTLTEPSVDFTGMRGRLIVEHTISDACGTETLKDTVDLPECNTCCRCDSLFKVSKIQHFPPGLEPGCCCCWRIKFDRGCLDVYGITSNAPTIKVPLGPNKIQPGSFIGTFICVNAGEKKDLVLYFLNRCGDTICSQTVKLDCPPSCCTKVDAVLVPMVQPQAIECICKYAVYASYTDPNCKFKNIIVTTGNGTRVTQTLFSLNGLAPFTSYKVGEACVESGIAMCQAGRANDCYIPVYVKVCFVTETGDTCCKELRDSCYLPTFGGPPIGKVRAENGFVSVDMLKQPPANAISLYPNPVKDMLTVKINEQLKPLTGTVSIRTTAGQLVQQVPMKVPPYRFNIKLGGLRPGTYFIQFTGSDGLVHKTSFVKE